MSITQLPDEIIEVIFGNMPDADLLRSTAVCKAWNTISDSSWKTRAILYSSSIVPETSWQRCYYDLVMVRFGDCEPSYSTILDDGFAFYKHNPAAWSIARLKHEIVSDSFYFEILIEVSMMYQIMIGIIGEMQDGNWQEHLGYCKYGFGYYGTTGRCENFKQGNVQLAQFSTGQRVGCYVGKSLSNIGMLLFLYVIVTDCCVCLLGIVLDFINERLIYYVDGKEQPPAFTGMISRDKVTNWVLLCCHCFLHHTIVVDWLHLLLLLLLCV
eukprot:TRINITY_DN1603_c0_g1_i1.p1 TRINITY_DN1603_c0_g1~~TRINITY_DN1603_c0_g1_i1.p1  ORF type:complete len:292 (-),score=30.91 TRINITY_DN1603_c0_g1_i1:175-981(-)